MTEPKYLGLLRWCEVGRELYDAYCDITNDDSRPAFDDAWAEAFTAWKEHRDNCDECGYV